MARKKRKMSSFQQFIPNLITLMAICAGLTSVRLGFEGRFEPALYLILLAALFDGVDGKVARYLDCASPFGAELDSLADFFNFGIAPGLLIYQVFFHGTDYAYFGWLAVLFLSVACALRLARFNVALPIETDKKNLGSFFVGVPAPALASLSLLPMYLQVMGYEWLGLHPVLIAFYMFFAGSLAISTIPTFSIKHVNFKENMRPMILIISILLVIFLFVFPWETIVFANLAYIVSFIFSYRKYRQSPTE